MNVHVPRWAMRREISSRFACGSQTGGCSLWGRRWVRAKERVLRRASKPGQEI